MNAAINIAHRLLRDLIEVQHPDVFRRMASGAPFIRKVEVGAAAAAAAAPEAQELEPGACWQEPPAAALPSI